MMPAASGGTTMNLSDVLDIVRNESRYTKMMADLQEQTEKANKATAELSKAKDLDAALKNAREAELVAQSLLKEARDKATRMDSESREAAQKIIDEAKDKAANLDDALSTKRRELTSVAEQVELLDDKLQQGRSELVKAQSEANALREQSTLLRAQIKEKQAALAALLG